MTHDHVLIAGGGIGGLVLALTLHQIGVPCTVFESVRELKPLGVGINIQPNAIRELEDLGISEADLDEVGIPAREWALVGLNGREIYSEPRGKVAGYDWHQYAVHRGAFHLMLCRKVVERLGPEALKLGHKVTGYRKRAEGGVTALVDLAGGGKVEVDGTLLFGADGIHSSVRAQMHPDQPPIHWGGTIMWRGTARGVPIRTGSSFVGLGTSRHRVVIYPISHPDEEGLADINWIAEKTYDTDHDWRKSGWFRPVELAEFAHEFDGFVYDWLNLPELLAKSDVAYENPMIDRDPLPTWVDGPVALMGDAAHPMYPTGSNGASQAIVDARVIGRELLAHGVTPAALRAFDEKLCGPIGQVAMRNRGSGPFGLLELVEERCGGAFEDIEDVLPAAERSAFMLAYQQAAGFARDTLNAAPPTIEPGALVAKVAA
ncbi:MULTISPECIES: flavin-dependent oxidoreductase [unclassified Sphingobium]|uniref:flavin-dependent oxidoreductase n=1 Tax=unclassified Sphingobium TaxID=2611147 RepID=UPI002224A04B|nr:MULTISPECIES: flavin-dependent oxidoreductase [unclassified Sphingobium]MCW2350856.1 2-polyprenyl-6-methoxyphenol hydroxylase-like FAD-dependent oxidoreductase [Sphingobium sp. B12D2B]MCW2369972.1 2-polyprenyl-6-methoxyphenol hydroxylase-like FAD-dependent oxidoreductase [Sphingobium sp. B11D3D]MCW2390303.1 2-polyprenyl-6-methoxyphenol hydroxylase-like FAD-dependent oxidoreductase [Sphingobium sp. B11D3A]